MVNDRIQWLKLSQKYRKTKWDFFRKSNYLKPHNIRYEFRFKPFKWSFNRNCSLKRCQYSHLLTHDRHEIFFIPIYNTLFFSYSASCDLSAAPVGHLLLRCRFRGEIARYAIRTGISRIYPRKYRPYFRFHFSKIKTGTPEIVFFFFFPGLNCVKIKPKIFGQWKNKKIHGFFRENVSYWFCVSWVTVLTWCR